MRSRLSRRAFMAAAGASAIYGCGGASEQPPASAGKFDPNWESIQTHEVPQWYHDAKLGIFVHWGLYSVPAWATPIGELGEID